MFCDTLEEEIITTVNRPLLWIIDHILAWLILLGITHSHDAIAALVVMTLVFVVVGAATGVIIGIVVVAVRRRKAQRPVPPDGEFRR